jgi:hypothetical protein
MTMIWRLQQSQMLLGMMFWTATLTLLLDPYTSTFFIQAGISSGQVALRLILLFLLVLSGILLVGFTYDRVFRLWKDYVVVNTERSPYSREKLVPKELVWFKHYWIPMLKDVEARNGTGPVNSRVLEKWIALNIESDPILKRDYLELLGKLGVEDGEMGSQAAGR